ncbi:17756_t:CDS:10 [Entrophospora sp. SA101]|nr:17756_t:CDS:10 [Entrophospora sp. SA101]
MFESIYFIFLSIAIIGAINSILLLYYNSVRKSYHAIGVNTDHKTYQDVGVQTDESTSLQQESSLSSSEDNTIADINNDVVSVDSLTEPVDLETSKGLIIVNLESESDIDDELNIMTNNTNTVIAKSIVEDNESNDDVSTNDSDIDDEYDSTDNTTKSDDDIIQGNNCLMQVAHVEYVESEISTNNIVVNYNVVNNAVNNNFTQEGFRQKLLRWIVTDDQPFVVTEDRSFREMLAGVYINILSQVTVHHDLSKKIKELVCKHSQGSLFTVDAWTIFVFLKDYKISTKQWGVAMLTTSLGKLHAIGLDDDDYILAEEDTKDVIDGLNTKPNIKNAAEAAAGRSKNIIQQLDPSLKMNYYKGNNWEGLYILEAKKINENQDPRYLPV